MTINVVQADWVSGSVLLLRDRNRFPIIMTQPRGVNGSDLLPLSLIGCAAWDVLHILRKQRQPVTGLRVTAQSAQDDAAPWRFREIDIRYEFRGQALSAAKARRAIEISQEKYCSVFVTLRDAVTIRSGFEIVTEGAPAPIAATLANDEAVSVVIAFNQALNARDLDTMMGLMTPDCVFENTVPPPDGARYEGQAAVRAFWERFFEAAPHTKIEIEEILGADDRCVMRWVYHWTGADGSAGHVRGVDLYTLRDGLIAEKLSYVKG
ncbi:MAG: nuclear transport factor 2 family protein [Anaerolineae bacterium]|nr:nuclear transport factor 2 family protein [Anaerolineae bacterium]